MRRIRKVTLWTAVLVFLLSGCATTPTRDIEFDAQLDPEADLAAYRSYAWIGSVQLIHDPRGQWKPPKFNADLELKFLINRELRERGLVEVTRNPDLLIAFAAGVDMTALDTKYDAAEKLKILEETPKGALAVLLVDARTGNAVWAGVARANVQQKQLSYEDVRKRMDYAVRGIFKLLPEK